MNVSDLGNHRPASGQAAPRILGLRPAPALAALGLALGGAWVLATTGDGDSAGYPAATAPAPAEPRALADQIRPTTAPAAMARSRTPVAAAPAAAGRPTDPALRQQPAAAAPGAAAYAAPSLPGARPGEDDAGSSATMYLTIVGDQTVVSYGPAGQRTARLDDLVTNRGAPARPDDAGGAAASDDFPVDGDVDGAQMAAEDSTPADMGPEPQQCPRTLPAGSTQADADQLRGLYSCRYLSGCRIGDGQCTFYYQGRG